MANITLFIEPYEFEYFLKGDSFEGLSTRRRDSDIIVSVPLSAVKNIQKLGNETWIRVYAKDQW